jgi:hypothetical protein
MALALDPTSLPKIPFISYIALKTCRNINSPGTGYSLKIELTKRIAGRRSHENLRLGRLLNKGQDRSAYAPLGINVRDIVEEPPSFCVAGNLTGL